MDNKKQPVSGATINEQGIITAITIVAGKSALVSNEVYDEVDIIFDLIDILDAEPTKENPIEAQLDKIYSIIDLFQPHLKQPNFKPIIGDSIAIGYGSVDEKGKSKV